VFIADNIKEVIPEFLMLLKGVIDCPDLPLNVSRSALQNDGFVKKINEYITKKVADKLSGMCKTEKEEYEKYWDDISPFIKFGCLKDDKFCEKMTDYILFKNLDGVYMTLPECLEVNKIDPDEAEAVDENGEKVEAEVVDENGETVSGEDAEAEEEKKEKVIYYVTDEKQQSQYINMFKSAKMDAVILTHNIDQPFVSQLEAKNEGIKFQRIDADLTDTFKAKTSQKAEKEMEEQAEEIAKLMKKVLKKDAITVKVEKLKNKKISSMITLSEESRRMQDMMKMYSMPGMDMGMFGNKEGETLILNANHPLVEYVLEHKDGENVKMICEQLYDLALLQQAPLEPEAMTKFVARSNDIMLLLTK
ncbi:MAG: molecular chaperone HtpG, partial [Lachnospiraceae bacterium]|nr:molecular chaperone HtpG [Lachnospiraceae bacterium]